MAVQCRKHFGRNDVATDNSDRRRRLGGFRLFNQPPDIDDAAIITARGDDAIGVGLIRCHIHDRNHIAAIIGLGHFRDATLAEDQIISQQNGHRVIADEMARAPDGVTQPGRLLLSDILHSPGTMHHRLDKAQRVALALGLQGGLKLKGVIKVILDGGLVAPGDEDELLNTGRCGFLNRILDQRLVDHRQHFLGHRLGGR